MGATITPLDRSAEEPDVRVTLRRMIRYAKPYIGIVVVAMLCALVFSGARYGRAYLMKPLLDDVMLPYQAVASSSIDWLPGFSDSETIASNINTDTGTGNGTHTCTSTSTCTSTRTRTNTSVSSASTICRVAAALASTWL